MAALQHVPQRKDLHTNCFWSLLVAIKLVYGMVCLRFLENLVHYGMAFVDIGGEKNRQVAGLTIGALYDVWHVIDRTDADRDRHMPQVCPVYGDRIGDLRR